MAIMLTSLSFKSIFIFLNLIWPCGFAQSETSVADANDLLFSGGVWLPSYFYCLKDSWFCRLIIIIFQWLYIIWQSVFAVDPFFYTEILLPDLLSNIHACQWVTVNMCSRKAEPSWSIICDLLTIIEVTILNP